MSLDLCPSVLLTYKGELEGSALFLRGLGMRGLEVHFSLVCLTLDNICCLLCFFEFLVKVSYICC